jgi:enoyl-CoA hydratase
MTYETLLHDIAGPIATVTLNRPKVLNALNAQLLNELEHLIAELKAHSAVRVILITGAGERAFAAGADINELAATDAVSGKQFALRGQTVFGAIESCGKPVIALLNGFALGGGCELALACTLRIASETARLGQPEVKLGIVPGYGATQRLPRLVGPAAALKLLLTGEIIDATEALRIGLVNEVVPPQGLLARGRSVAEQIIAMSPLGVAGCLEAVHRGAGLPLDEALAVEVEIIARLCGSEDKHEGTTAFLEKRTPIWKSR